MRRALFAGLALGIVAGVLFVFHDAVQLSLAWPIVLGLAMWGTVGRGGTRGALAAAAAVAGVGVAYLSFAVLSEYLSLTNLAFGTVVGFSVGAIVLVGVLAGDRFPMAGMLLGYAAFMGLFEARWAETPAAFRTQGIEAFTVAALGVVAGVVAVTLVRALGDRMMQPEASEPKERTPKAEAAAEGGAR